MDTEIITDGTIHKNLNAQKVHEFLYRTSCGCCAANAKRSHISLILLGDFVSFNRVIKNKLTKINLETGKYKIPC